ncbi:hypothetical protein M378DRAFT_391554 [Amanita muscaria Koide BX008]|uniref:Uncharacterized protein n=1 Tax=Amanita muscaria (strain Koide BX008) TaxID=946122 RepID=A0A0C2WXF6_AMAMK|nr:hypothetical protein M378DRAFT_391554 [Amanita muscaria Koide BX008]
MSSSSATETPSPSLISEPPSMNRGNGDAQSREAEDGFGGNLDFAIPTSAGGIAKELDSVNPGEPVVQREEAPSMSTAQRASNPSNQIPPTQNPGINTGGGAHFQSAHFTGGGGHAFGTNSIVNNKTFTIIRSGDGQFTESQRNLVRRGYTSQSKANPMCVDI